MNTNLAMFFGDDYLSVAVQPYEGKLSILSSTDDKRFDLYFYTNPHNSNIEFGADYKNMFLKKSPLYFGDVLENIDKGGTFQYGGTEQGYLMFFDCIIKVVRELYQTELRKYDSSFAISEDTDIQASAIFLDNISANTKTKIEDYFRTKHINISRTETVDTMAVSYCCAVSGKFCQNRKFAVLEAMGYNLNMTIVNADSQTYTRKESRKFPGYGIDPMVKVIAEHIVNSVNRSQQIIASDDRAEYLSEIRRHYVMADQVIRMFETHPDRTTFKVNTVFACQPESKFPVNISLEDINKKAYIYSRQYVGFFENNFLNENNVKTSELENIILVGKSLGNNSIRQEFETFGKDKLVNYSDTDAMNFMIELFKEKKESAPDEPDDEGTMFMPGPSTPADNGGNISDNNINANSNNVSGNATTHQPDNPIQRWVKQTVGDTYQPVSSLNVAQLKPGTKVYLNTFDPTPNKGKAFQELEYQGNGQFVVVSSSRSLHFGDLATPVSMNWTTGVQLDFMIIRGGRDLGRFRTRVVMKISVK